MIRLSGSVYSLGADRLTVLTRYGLYLARLELHSPCNMVIMFTLAADALALIIDEQLSLISLIVISNSVFVYDDD